MSIFLFYWQYEKDSKRDLNIQLIEKIDLHKMLEFSFLSSIYNK